AALERPSLSLPSIFMTELAQAELWLSWGIEPVAMTGHSLGEYTAACLAGVMSVADALEIVTLRGKLFETLPEGGMISVPLPEAELEPLLVDALTIAVINNPDMCVVSGEVESIAKLETILTEREVESRRVQINVAAHSPMLEPILAPFKARLSQMTFNPPQRPFISNMTGTWADPEAVVDPQYWVHHLRHTVRFADGLATLMAEPERIFLEVGPGQTLSSLVRQHPAKQKSHLPIPSMRHHKEDVSDLWYWHSSIGKLWAAGAAFKWMAQYADEYRRRIPLPTYAFDHQRYWIEPGTQIRTSMVPPQSARLAKLPNLADWFYKPAWVTAPPVETLDQETAVNWLIFADAYGVGKALGNQLAAAGHEVVYVTPGKRLDQMDMVNY
ncbi:MAG: acyltransferase domain-containing protein, partial [Anaerolineales bacterium]|nr:acyltransferase domain-containing protein [Anaerolineales bacterium]